MISLFRFLFTVLVTFALLSITGIFSDTYQRAFNKCDHMCGLEKRYGKVSVRFAFPVMTCNCYGSGRMPDDYLRSKK